MFYTIYSQMEKYVETETVTIEFVDDDEQKSVGWREMLQMQEEERKKRQMDRYDVDLRRLYRRKIAGITLFLATIVAIVIAGVVISHRSKKN